MSLLLLFAIAAVALFAGATASIVGFGIGSLLTPFLAWRFGTDIAVAAVALPHLSGSVLRGWRLREFIDRAILLRFGILSAIGGLVGALAFAQFSPAILSRILGALLLLTATAGVTDWSRRWQPRGGVVWLLGVLSGFFGGVVGNQGGLRAAALTRFDLKPLVFVATSTAVGVIIDAVRTPVYLNRSHEELSTLIPVIAVMIGGVIVGTVLGERLLLGLSQERFRYVVSTAIGILGLWFLAAPI
jgi:uncharacterized membrane protein YfcA